MTTADINHGTSAYDVAYSYDGFGNMTRRTVTGAMNQLQMFEVDPSTNRLRRVCTSGGNCDAENPSAVPVSYDANGNMNVYGERGYVFDPQNRLLDVWQQDEQLAGHKYDASGHRVYSIVDGVETFYLRDETGQLLSEFARSMDSENEPAWNRDYVYALGQATNVIKNQVPASPRNPRVTDISFLNGLKVWWDPPDEPDVYQTIITRTATEPGGGSGPNNDPRNLPVPKGGITGTLDNFAGLSIGPDIEITYKLKAKDFAVNFSDSITLVVRPFDSMPPPTPTGGTAEPMDGAVRLTWDPVVDDGDLWGYEVLRGDGLIGPLEVISSQPVRQPIFMDYSVTNGQGYRYSVRSVDTAGFASLNSASIPATGVVTPQDNVPPARPTGVRAGAGLSAGTVVIDWQLVLDPDVVGYMIYGSQNASQLELLCDPLLDPTDCPAVPWYLAAGLSEGAEYYVEVVAYDSSGNVSLSSDQVFTRTRSSSIPSPQLSVPTATVDESGTPVTSNPYPNDSCNYSQEDDDVLGVQLNWTPAPGVFDGYHVYRAYTGGVADSREAENLIYTRLATIVAGEEPKFVDNDINEFAYRYYVVTFVGPDESPASDDYLGAGEWDPTAAVRAVVGHDGLLTYDTRNRRSRVVTLNWSRVVAPEVRGYHVYRRCRWETCNYRVTQGGPNMVSPSCEHSWVRLTPWPLTTRVFADTTLGGLDGCYDYLVRTVGPDFQEGNASKILATTLFEGFLSGYTDGLHCYEETEMYSFDNKLYIAAQVEKDRINNSTRGELAAGGEPDPPTGISVSLQTKLPHEILAGQRKTKYFAISWTPNSEKDIAGYHVEMAGSYAGEWERLTKNLVAWWDPHYETRGVAVQSADPSVYIGPINCAHFRIIAVDENGNESTPGYPSGYPLCSSAPTPAAPQNVVTSTAIVGSAAEVSSGEADVTQEELDAYGTSCANKLQWEEVPDATSYHVYRRSFFRLSAFYFYRTQVVDAAASCSGGTCTYVERGDHNVASTNPNDDCPYPYPPYSYGRCDGVDSDLEAYFVTAVSEPEPGVYLEGPKSPVVFWQCDEIYLLDGTVIPEGYVLHQPEPHPELTLLASATHDQESPAHQESNHVAAYETGQNGLRPRPPTSPTSLLVAPLALLAGVNPPYEINDIHVDHLGSTRLVTDEAGNIKSRHDFFPFGEEMPPLYAEYNTTKLFTGHERDKTTGLHYMVARYYGGDLPRFLSPDPLGGSEGDPQSLNRYSYVLNNPLNLIDPKGLYGINPNPYNPGGSSPCDGMGPMCTVEFQGDTDGEVEKEIEKRATADPGGFGKKWTKIKGSKKKHLIIKVGDTNDVDMDYIDPKKQKRKTTTLEIDVSDIERAERISRLLGAQYQITKAEAIAHAVTDGISYAYNGNNYLLAHEEGRTYQNNAIRIPEGRIYINAIDTVQGSHRLIVKYRDATVPFIIIDLN